MRIYRKPNRAIENSVITIGSYDGIHLGHQAVIAKTIAVAKSQGCACGLVTFDPIPQQVIHPEFHYILTTLNEKKEILSQLGLDFLYLINFNKKIQSLAPTEFIKTQIIETIHPTKIVVGYDHRFGSEGRGDVELLKILAKKFGFKLLVVSECLYRGEPIKSTRIRERLLLGDIKTANRLLGRNYSISGKVTKGLGIGKLIGFPTVNLMVSETKKLIPMDGVYAVYVVYQGKRYPGAMNIGCRPTFSGDVRTIEATLLNPPKSNLYGAKLKIELVDRIRSEQKFENITALASQIAKDIKQAEKILKSEN
ncbi:MAG: bifunctional riboflavin kinase/FAD synthetase [candidate division WOR-3 bacterium]